MSHENCASPHQRRNSADAPRRRASNPIRGAPRIGENACLVFLGLPRGSAVRDHALPLVPAVTSRELSPYGTTLTWAARSQLRIRLLMSASAPCSLVAAW